MKRTFVTLIATLLIALVLSSCSQAVHEFPVLPITTTPASSTPIVFSTYNGNGFAIPYPASWGTIPLKTTGSYRSGVVLFQDLQQGTVIAYFLITEEHLSQKVSVEDYFAFQRAQLPSNYSEYTPIGTSNITVDGNEAIEHTWSYTNSNSNKSLSVEEYHLLVCTVEGETAWSFEADSIFLDDYMSTLNTMIAGFHTLNQ